MAENPTYDELEQKVKSLEAELFTLKRTQSFQSLVENSPDVICRIDKKIRHVYINKAVENFTGQPHSFYIGKTHKEMQLPDNVCTLCEQEITEVFETKQESLFEFDLPSPEGTVYIQSHLVPEISETGEVETVLCISRDITELKNAEKSLRLNEQKLQKITDSIPGGIFQYQVFPDGTYRFLFMTQGVVELYGVTAKKIEQNPDVAWDAIHPDDLSDSRESVRLSAESLTPWEHEYRILTPEGKIKWIRGNAIPEAIPEDGSIVWTGILLNISQRKQAEAEKIRLENQLRHGQKMEALGILAGGIAHDFNNILNSAYGFLEVIKDGIPKNDKNYDHLQGMSIACKRASELTKQILIFSRQGFQQRKHIRLQPIIDESILLLELTAHPNIKFKVDINQDCGSIYADSSQMQQVCLNIIKNAIQELQNDGGTLAVELKEVEVNNHIEGMHPKLDKGKYALLSVEDTGHGIEGDILTRIFDPYFTTRTFSEGTGLGLAIAHGIVENHDGCILVNSTLGQGTLFRIYLPIAESREKIVQKEAGAIPSVDKISNHILFVDDEKISVQIWGIALEQEGFTVTGCTNGREAIETFRRDPDQFDIVITDQRMPGMSGTDLARELHNIRSDIPMIIATGWDDTVDKDSARQFGVKGIITKPHEMKDLLEIIYSLLQ
ncbi:response regulator [Thermodesulfobacteriota bacterium]